MSSAHDLINPRFRWLVTPAKLFGWFIGLFIAFFGSVLYASPFATYVGLSHVIVIAGLILTFSYAVAMSGTCAPRSLILLLTLISLAAVVFGRYFAPINELIASIRTGEDQLKGVGPLTTFGTPLLLIGIQLLQLFTPWIRDHEQLSWWRSIVSMIGLQGGAITLGVGAALTTPSDAFYAQPYWLWLAVPLAFLLGTGLRTRWHGFAWFVMGLLTALVLPLLWWFMSSIDRPPLTTQIDLRTTPPAATATQPLRVVASVIQSPDLA